MHRAQICIGSGCGAVSTALSWQGIAVPFIIWKALIPKSLCSSLTRSCRCSTGGWANPSIDTQRQIYKQPISIRTLDPASKLSHLMIVALPLCIGQWPENVRTALTVHRKTGRCETAGPPILEASNGQTPYRQIFCGRYRPAALHIFVHCNALDAVHFQVGPTIGFSPAY